MDCEKCLALIDDFLDAKLSSAESAAIGEHLQICVGCAVFHEDLTAVFESCEDLRGHLAEPPNSQALWLRISNLIESEQTALALAETKNVVPLASKTSWWARSWQLSFQQMASAVLGIAVITSLLTVVGLQNAASVKNSIAVQFFQSSETHKPAGRTIELENRLKEQQMAIEYWNRRVESRRNQWNRNLREAFDRNLTAINQVVTDYETQLQSNPEDKISEEMLDAALKDKMELLREFSEL
jgi:hypothetical protein